MAHHTRFSLSNTHIHTHNHRHSHTQIPTSLLSSPGLPASIVVPIGILIQKSKAVPLSSLLCRAALTCLETTSQRLHHASPRHSDLPSLFPPPPSCARSPHCFDQAHCGPLSSSAALTLTHIHTGSVEVLSSSPLPFHQPTHIRAQTLTVLSFLFLTPGPPSSLTQSQSLSLHPSRRPPARNEQFVCPSGHPWFTLSACRVSSSTHALFSHCFEQASSFPAPPLSSPSPQ